MGVDVRFCGIGLCVFCAIATIGAAEYSRALQRSGRVDVVAITGVSVVDVENRSAASAVRVGQTVLIEAGRIARVGTTATVPVPPGAVLVDGRDRFLIAGLWDSHAHVSNAGVSAMAAYVANGVTSVRDLGGRLSDLRTWKAQIAAGTLVGPRLFTAGPTLEGAWWLDAVLRILATDSALRGFPLMELSPRYRLGSAADARAAVDAIVALGVDIIKFRNLRGDEFRAVAAEAKRHKLPLVGHAPRDVSLGEAAALGMRSIEHAETVMLTLDSADVRQRRAQLVQVASSGATVTPTLVSDVAYRQTSDAAARAILGDAQGRLDGRRKYVSPSLIEAWTFALASKKYDPPTDWAESHHRQVADTQRARDAGVSLMVGTDLGVPFVYPGFSVHDELRLLVDEVRLSPIDALRGATIIPSRNMRLADCCGQMAPGQRADLVLLDANPLQDIRNTTRIRAVLLNGRYLDRTALDALLATAQRTAAERDGQRR
jgi:imidazolonepropionase-like amidohydrolase